MIRALLLLALLFPVVAPASLLYQEGMARAPDSLTPLYQEQHWLRMDGTRPRERLVVYRCPDGTAFARKRIDYRASLVAPEFRLIDARSGYQEGLRRLADGAAALWVRAGTTAEERSAAVDAANLVADAGFDAFIDRHWPALAAGQSVALAFALPSRLQSLDFRVARVGQTRLDGEPAWIFRLRLGGWLGWLAPHIDVVYGQQSRRLLRFEGLSNLRDDRGDAPLLARIDFPLPARIDNEARWQDALSEPLTACRVGGQGADDRTVGKAD